MVATTNAIAKVAAVVAGLGLVAMSFASFAPAAKAAMTAEEIAARRVAITQNRVMVSLPVGDAPSNHLYWATYTVGLETGERDIDPTGVEYLTPGVWTFSFSEDRA